VPSGEHHQERGLGAFQAEDDRVRIRCLDRFDVRVPVLVRIHPELGPRVGRLTHHVERVLDVLRCEGPAIVPQDVLVEEEDERAVAVLPGPSLRELADDRVGALDLLRRVEEHEVVEARHGRPDRGDGGGLVDREPHRELFPLHDVENAAVLRRRAGALGARGDGGDRGERPHHRDQHQTAEHANPPRRCG